MDLSVFVYGTLKRGQCREHLWPIPPVCVLPAWTRCTLYSRIDYPAMTAGQDQVLGEVWQFTLQSIDRVLHTLDMIEGTNQPGQADLYLRVTTEVWTPGNEALGTAWTYHYASDPINDGFTRLQVAEGNYVQWPSAIESPLE